VATNKESGSSGRRDTESMDSGDMGARNRSTPGRSVSELGVDPDEARGQDLLGVSEAQGGSQSGPSDDGASVGGNLAGTRTESGARKNPPLTEDIALGEGGITQSGGAAGGARGHAGTSDRGAGGPLGDMRS
jgi:hypothetical protein